MSSASSGECGQEVISGGDEGSVMHVIRQQLAAQGNTDTRIMVMGDDGVGKSALVVRFLTRRYIHDYDPTSESLYTFNTNINSRPVTFTILDTANLSVSSPAREDQIRWAQCFLLVFSKTDHGSFLSVAPALERIRRVKLGAARSCPLPLAVVANKCDLIHASQVSSLEACALANDHSALYYEISASEDIEKACEPFLALHQSLLGQASGGAGGSSRLKLAASQPFFSRARESSPAPSGNLPEASPRSRFRRNLGGLGLLARRGAVARGQQMVAHQAAAGGSRIEAVSRKERERLFEGRERTYTI